MKKKLTNKPEDVSIKASFDRAYNAFVYGSNNKSLDEQTYEEYLKDKNGHSVEGYRSNEEGSVNDFQTGEDKFAVAVAVVADEFHERVATGIPGLFVLKRRA